ncbi:dipeptidase [Alkalibacter rhizosphaerae]|uniref:Dipeptidase n=1 Tax=Alkalibacter rhizosphaerae TaxID=2815577 RepID=A0A974XG46_9FIRM|nr:dipeptidase [Alkalibacter rhizosphaerae]QSX08100.1 dipeptidase [Alkalibacter rhizosphaerae]
MRIIDLHCDTMARLHKDKSATILANDFSVDLNKLKKGQVDTQFFAMFLNLEKIQESGEEPYPYLLDFYKTVDLALKSAKTTLNKATNMDDVEQNRQDNTISAILTIEEGGFLQGDICRLDQAYDMGVRLITLTWNYENCIGFPNYKDPAIMDKGLKPFGFEVVEAMNEKGMIVDVSHLSDGGFFDCIRHSKKPVIASHSNCRALTNVTRNMTDDMIRLLADKGGVMGLNFAPMFLGPDQTSRVDDMVAHVLHMKNVGGEDVLALGSDFDGIGGVLEIDSSGDLMRLVEALGRSGMSDTTLEKFCWRNAQRVMEDCLGNVEE